MKRPTTAMLRIGDWCVDPSSGQISRSGETARLDVRAMRLLVALAERVGQVVSIDDLLNHAWPEVAVSPDSVYQAVASLRRVLGDDPRQPAYIETVPRLGYRMLARVSPWPGEPIALAVMPSDPPDGARPMPTASDAWRAARRRRIVFAWAAGATLCLALSIGLRAFLFQGKGVRTALPAIAAQSQRSIAVLPFLDLTQGMKQEEFADGMTEELIDRLNKIPGLRVPPPTSSFYYKGKQIPVADIARALGVAYVLDGSVRKSGAMVRVAARLVRADSGSVVWSETYDRPFDDILGVQDDIAGQVTAALKASIDTRPDH